MTLHFLNDAAKDTESTQKSKNYIIIASFQCGTSFVDHLCYLVLVFVMLSRLFITALWSPAWTGQTYLLSFLMFNFVFCHFPCGMLGQVWHLSVLIPDFCQLLYFDE